MMFSLGTRFRALSTRIGVYTFSFSLRLIESELVRVLSRAKDRMADGSKALKPVPLNEGSPEKAGLPTSGIEKVNASEARGLPIIFIHQNNSGHLKYSFAQAKASNPQSTVFVLGDDSNRDYPDIRHHSLDRYFDGAAKFKEVYRHYSTHSVGFELICFQRWFILRDFMKAQGFEQCVYLDSDVLLYANVTEEINKFSRFDFTLCWNTIGCVFFLNRLEGLNSFCDFLMDLYSKKDPYTYDRIVAHFAARRKHGLPGGACDMTALQLYNELNFGRVGEASYVVDGSVYDPNINMPHPGFEMENGVKKITWKQGMPFGRYIRTGEEIRFNSLHFNGKAKRLMGQYCTAEPTHTAGGSLKTG